MSTLQILSEFSSIILLLVQLLFAWGIWSLRKMFVRKADCDNHCRAFDDSNHELKRADAALAARLDGLPSGGELHTLRVELTAVKGEILALAVQVKGQNDVMARLERSLDMLVNHHIKGD